MIGYNQFQIDFMKDHGLKKEMKFLDIGCGSLRGGRHFINYLNPYKYFGIDCNRSLVDLGRQKELGINFWKVRDSNFVIDEYFEFNKFSKIFDSALAFSLFTHLPPIYLELCLSRLSKVFRRGSKFYATFWLCDEKVNFEDPIKQCEDIVSTHSYKDPFHYKLSTIEKCLTEEWSYSLIDFNHPRNQKMLCFLKEKD
jgi:SAM-dependent methyltransferase